MQECGDLVKFDCPKCRAITPTRGKFCGDCGHDLREAKVAPFIGYSQPRSYATKFLADKIPTTCSTLEEERKLLTVLCANVASRRPMFFEFWD